jgi:hypothetical protein
MKSFSSAVTVGRPREIFLGRFLYAVFLVADFARAAFFVFFLAMMCF